MDVGLPCGSLRHAQRLLAFLLKRLHLNLHECFDLGPIAPAICANGLLPDFGKKKRITARPFRATSARSRLWQKRFVLRVKWRVREVQMDFPLNPCAKLPNRGRLGLLVFQDGGGVPVLRKAFLQSAALVIRLESCDFKRMSDCQLFAIEGLLRFGNELNQTQSSTHVLRRSANSGSNAFNGVS